MYLVIGIMVLVSLAVLVHLFQKRCNERLERVQARMKQFACIAGPCDDMSPNDIYRIFHSGFLDKDADHFLLCPACHGNFQKFSEMFSDYLGFTQVAIRIADSHPRIIADPDEPLEFFCEIAPEFKCVLYKDGKGKMEFSLDGAVAAGHGKFVGDGLVGHRIMFSAATISPQVRRDLQRHIAVVANVTCSVRLGEHERLMGQASVEFRKQS